MENKVETGTTKKKETLKERIINIFKDIEILKPFFKWKKHPMKGSIQTYDYQWDEAKLHWEYNGIKGVK